jgi:CubicO group peptidase (beta-lactamase class C family)
MKLVATDKAATSEKTTGPKTEFCIGGSSGGVLSCAGDYARFGQMLLNGGELDGVRIIGGKTVALMIGNHTGDMTIPITGPGFHWGLGVAIYHGRDRLAPLIRSVGTYGWGGAAGTTYFADPAEELMGVCLTQVSNHGAMPNNTY